MSKLPDIQFQPAPRVVRALWPWLLLLLFSLRVAGQFTVAVWNVSFLPPMEERFSGVVSYSVLMPVQLAILGLMTMVCPRFSRGEGWFARPHARLGRVLVWFGLVYLIVMVLRYVPRMTLYPAERWTGGSIPIFFPWVLAAFLFVAGRIHTLQAVRQRRPSRVLGIAVIALSVGPWAHPFSPELPGGYDPRNYRIESLAPSIPWFDQHLKMDRDAVPLPPVKLFVLGENVWRDEQEWPLARAAYQRYFLDGGRQPGALLTGPPQQGQTMTYVFDPTNPVRSHGNNARYRKPNGVLGRPDAVAYCVARYSTVGLEGAHHVYCV